MPTEMPALLTGASTTAVAAPLTYKALLAGMDTAQRQVLVAHTTGLRPALQAKRAALKKLTGLAYALR
jgi:hypothetical protein